MTTSTDRQRPFLDFGLRCLPVTHFEVTSDPQKPIPFEKVIACLYRLTSEGGIEVVSQSFAEGPFAFLNVAGYQTDERVVYCVWAIQNGEKVGCINRHLFELRMHGEEGTAVDGVLLSSIASGTNREERRVYRLINS